LRLLEEEEVLRRRGVKMAWEMEYVIRRAWERDCVRRRNGGSVMSAGVSGKRNGVMGEETSA
jgi:hypothetical protein